MLEARIGCSAPQVRIDSLINPPLLKQTYNPNNHPGTIDANAFVYLSLSDEKPVARLTLRGNVLPGADEWARYPYIMGKLRLKQNRMEFKISGKRLSERILCGNSGEQELRLFVRNRRLSVRREKLI